MGVPVLWEKAFVLRLEFIKRLLPEIVLRVTGFWRVKSWLMFSILFCVAL